MNSAVTTYKADSVSCQSSLLTKCLLSQKVVYVRLHHYGLRLFSYRPQDLTHNVTLTLTEGVRVPLGAGHSADIFGGVLMEQSQPVSALHMGS